MESFTPSHVSVLPPPSPILDHFEETHRTYSKMDDGEVAAYIPELAEAECDLLTVKAFNRLLETHPRIKVAILKNLNVALCQKLRKANRELSVFEV